MGDQALQKVALSIISVLLTVRHQCINLLPWSLSIMDFFIVGKWVVVGIKVAVFCDRTSRNEFKLSNNSCRQQFYTLLLWFCIKKRLLKWLNSKRLSNTHRVYLKSFQWQTTSMRLKNLKIQISAGNSLNFFLALRLEKTTTLILCRS